MPQLPQAPAGDDATSGSAIVSRRTVVAGTAWAVPAIVVSSAAPAFAASTCTASVTVHPLSCLLSTNPVQLQLALTLTTDCPRPPEGGDSTTYFVLQSIGFGPSGINATLEAIPGKPMTQLFYVPLDNIGGVPPQLQINGLFQYPGGRQEHVSFNVTTPMTACCYTPAP